jgi:hypothetical protein
MFVSLGGFLSSQRWEVAGRRFLMKALNVWSPQINIWIIHLSSLCFSFRQTESRKSKSQEQNTSQPSPSLILRAEPTVTSILKVDTSVYCLFLVVSCSWLLYCIMLLLVYYLCHLWPRTSNHYVMVVVVHGSNTEMELPTSQIANY